MKKLKIKFEDALKQSGFYLNNHHEEIATNYVFWQFVHICRKAMGFYFNVIVDTDVIFRLYLNVISNEEFLYSTKRRKGAILKTIFKDAYTQIVVNNDSKAFLWEIDSH